MSLIDVIVVGEKCSPFKSQKSYKYSKLMAYIVMLSINLYIVTIIMQYTEISMP